MNANLVVTEATYAQGRESPKCSLVTWSLAPSAHWRRGLTKRTRELMEAGCAASAMACRWWERVRVLVRGVYSPPVPSPRATALQPLAEKQTSTPSNRDTGPPRSSPCPLADSRRPRSFSRPRPLPRTRTTARVIVDPLPGPLWTYSQTSATKSTRQLPRLERRTSHAPGQGRSGAAPARRLWLSRHIRRRVPWQRSWTGRRRLARQDPADLERCALVCGTCRGPAVVNACMFGPLLTYTRARARARDWHRHSMRQVQEVQEQVRAVPGRQGWRAVQDVRRFGLRCVRRRAIQTRVRFISATASLRSAPVMHREAGARVWPCALCLAFACWLCVARCAVVLCVACSEQEQRPT